MKIVYQPNYVGLPWKSISKGVRNGMSSLRGNAGEDLSAARWLCALNQYSPGIFQGWGRQKKSLIPLLQETGMGMKEMLRRCWALSGLRMQIYKKWVFHWLNVSISESELGENQDPTPTRRKPTQLLWFHWCFKELISDLWFFPALSLHPLKTTKFDICWKKDKNIASVLLSLPAVSSPGWPCWEKIALRGISRADFAFPVISLGRNSPSRCNGMSSLVVVSARLSSHL